MGDERPLGAGCSDKLFIDRPPPATARLAGWEGESCRRVMPVPFMKVLRLTVNIDRVTIKRATLASSGLAPLVRSL